MFPLPSSFRDPCGQVFMDASRICRTVNHSYSQHWEACVQSGLFAAVTASRQLIPFSERPATGGDGGAGGSSDSASSGSAAVQAWKVLDVEKVPCITYPYEWCFSQLQDAALLTLDLQDEALARGCILKDASAYNVQFVGAKPIFIDILSFEHWEEGSPWAAYRQFCRHFLAPLALSAKVGLWCGALSRLWIDGIPLAHASSLLPWASRLHVGLAIHLFAHARMEARHADARVSAAKVKAVRMSAQALRNLTQSLRACVQGMKAPASPTEWGNYYADTNYTDAAQSHKSALVEQYAAQYAGGLAVDMGANTGRFSALLAPYFSTVVAADIDPLAVELHYQHLRAKGPDNIVPMVLDLGNPSPALGWANAEREAFAPRMQANFVTALALIHHLVVTAGIPLPMVAAYFATLLAPNGHLCMEFVPKEDSQVQRLLAARPDIFADYSLEGFLAAFGSCFSLVEQQPIEGSLRTLCVFQRTV